MTQASALEARIAAGREKKARILARCVWDAWTPSERNGSGVATLARRDRAYWRELADSAGVREPSADTIAVVIGKLGLASGKHLVAGS